MGWLESGSMSGGTIEHPVTNRPSKMVVAGLASVTPACLGIAEWQTQTTKECKVFMAR
jgi:hypothetical protein